MSEDLTSLEYEFLFDPAELWADKFQFENALASLFETKGIIAKVVSSGGRNVVKLSKKGDLASEVNKSLNDSEKEETNEEELPKGKIKTEDLGRLIKISLEGF